MELPQRQDLYLDHFESIQSTLSQEPDWLKSLRSAGMECFSSHGFPSLADEAWRFTSLRELAQIPFEFAEDLDSGLDGNDLSGLQFASLNCKRLVFLNGSYRPDLSDVFGVQGLTVSNLEAAVVHSPEVVEAHLGRYADQKDNPFVSLNTALSRDGFFVNLESGTRLEDPIHIVHLMSDSATPIRTHVHNLVIVGDSCEVDLVECYLGIGNNVTFTNPVTEICVGNNSKVNHYRIQNESPNGFHVGANDVQQGRDSHYRGLVIDLGGQLVRNNLRCVLSGEGGLAGIDGLYLLRGRQHVDNYTTLEHAVPHCDSRELFKGILDDRSSGVFRGRIIVHKDAQKTDSKQTSSNLLLTDRARINTKPQLEIYADDVKCTHGATIGQLDANALFYLRSRGIPLQAAKGILIFAFASELFEGVKVQSLGQQLSRYLEEWLSASQSTEGVYRQ
jgi:Fe-S cluster assembly protein SufD